MNANVDPLQGKSLAEVIAFCRANGVRKLTYNGLELELGPSSAGGASSPEDRLATAEALAGAMPTDAEMLGWSAPEFPRDLAELAALVGLDSWAGLPIKKGEG